MPDSVTAVEKAMRVFSQRGGMLRAKEAIGLGVHPRTLYALRDAGDLDQVGRGLYRTRTSPPLSNPDFVHIATRTPRAVICLISALAYHGLTTQVPHVVHIALPSHGQRPRIAHPPLQVYWYSEPSYGSGIETHDIDGTVVRIYSAEKTIADCFKYRNKIGLDIAVEALRTYRARKRKPDYRAIMEFAEMNRVQRVMRPYLEALL